MDLWLGMGGSLLPVNSRGFLWVVPDGPYRSLSNQTGRHHLNRVVYNGDMWRRYGN